MTAKHIIKAAQIRITEQMLLEWLQLPNGKLRGIYRDEHNGLLGQITLIVESDEFSTVEPGQVIPTMAALCTTVERIKQ